jgi:hypothetical protein
MRRLALAGALSLASMAFVAMAGSPANAQISTQQVPVSRDIVISQVSSQGPGGRFDEFVEIQNIGLADIDITGYTVSTCTVQNLQIPLFTVENQLTPGVPVVLAPGETWLIANVGYTRGVPVNQFYTSDVTRPALNEIQNFGGIIMRTTPVVAPGSYVDAVGFTRGLACTETAPARPQIGFRDQANLRVGLVDTNVNARDFVLYGPVLSATAAR